MLSVGCVSRATAAARFCECSPPQIQPVTYMTKQQANRIMRSAFDSMPNGPRSIEKATVNAADLEDCALAGGDLGLLLASIVGDDPNADPRLKFERALHEWDYVENADWTEGTGRNTVERRRVIYRRLRISNDLSVRADDLIPVIHLGSSLPLPSTTGSRSPSNAS